MRPGNADYALGLRLSIGEDPRYAERVTANERRQIGIRSPLPLVVNKKVLPVGEPEDDDRGEPAHAVS